MTTVSIIITCYNLGEYLHEALQSALAQTHPSVDVILVDDGSTEPLTIEVLDRLEPHPQVRVFRTPNQGVARARNFGIQQSRSDYILPLDADDRILPDYVNRAVAILDADPDIAFVGSHYTTFGVYEASCQPAAYRLPDMLIENVVPISSLFRRCVWEELGGYCDELKVAEDWDFWIGIMEHGYRGVVIPEILFEYRIRPASRNSQIRQPDVYQRAMQLIYTRHNAIYQRYWMEVLALKDRQFAHQAAHAHWLEEQRRAWEQAAQEQAVLIKQYGYGRIWWHTQIQRIQRILKENPSTAGRARAFVSGGIRVLRRRFRALLSQR